MYVSRQIVFYVLLFLPYPILQHCCTVALLHCCTVALLHCCTVARCYVIHWKLETNTFILFITNIPYDAFFRQHYFTTPLYYHPTTNLMAAPKPLFTEIKIFWRSTRFVDEYLYIQPKKHKTKFRIMFNC